MQVLARLARGEQRVNPQVRHQHRNHVLTPQLLRKDVPALPPILSPKIKSLSIHVLPRAHMHAAPTRAPAAAITSRLFGFETHQLDNYLSAQHNSPKAGCCGRALGLQCGVIVGTECRSRTRARM